jgi:thiamine-monophosphate kinase
MGGKPIAAFLSLALPRKLPQAWVNHFMKGFLALAIEFEVTLAGGDTAESPAGILADIIVVGSVPKGTAVLRSGARAGDRIYVTGELGGGAAALDELLAGRKVRPQDFPRHFCPVPRLVVAHALRKEKLASAMIDLSDGLSTDLDHICKESTVGAEIVSAAVPKARVGSNLAPVAIRHALHGGDDYELLFTAPRGKRVPNRIANVPVTLIGHVTRGRNGVLLDDRGLRKRLHPGGWQHFQR